MAEINAIPQVAVPNPLNQRPRRAINKRLMGSIFDMFSGFDFENDDFYEYYKYDFNAAGGGGSTFNRFRYKKFYEYAQKTRERVNRINEILKKEEKEALTDKEKQELQQLYDDVMDGFEDKQMKNLQEKMLKDLAESGYEAMKDGEMQIICSLATACESARNSIAIISKQETLKSGIEAYEKVEEQAKIYEEKRDAFTKAHPDFDLEKYEKETADLNKEISEFESENEKNIKVMASLLDEQIKDVNKEAEKITEGINMALKKIQAIDTLKKQNEDEKFLTEDKQNNLEGKAEAEALLNKEKEALQKAEQELAEALENPEAKKFDAIKKIKAQEEFVERYDKIAKAIADGANPDEIQGDIDALLADTGHTRSGFKTIPNDAYRKALTDNVETIKKTYENVVVDNLYKKKVDGIKERITTSMERVAEFETRIKARDTRDKEIQENLDKIGKERNKIITEYGVQNGNHDLSKQAYQGVVDDLRANREKLLKETEPKVEELKARKEEYKRMLNSRLDKSKKPLLERKEALANTIKEAKELYQEYRQVNRVFNTEVNKKKLHTVSNDVVKLIDNNVANIINRKVDVSMHKDSKEYKDMMEQLNAFKPGISSKERLDVLQMMSENARKYLAAKKKQIRPFPSATRLSRIAYAESVLSFAENTTKNLNELRNELPVLEEKVNTLAERGYAAIKKEDDYFKVLVGDDVAKAREAEAKAKAEAEKTKKEAVKQNKEIKPPVKEKKPLVKEELEKDDIGLGGM